MIPLAPNCTLTKIEGPNPQDDYRPAVGDGVDKWNGSSPAYVEDRRTYVRQNNPRQQPGAEAARNEASETMLVIDGELPEVKLGDYVTVTIDGQPRRREVWEASSQLFMGARLAQQLVVETL